jgi:hypothetical protein
MTGRSERILVVCKCKDALSGRSFPQQFFKPQSEFPRQLGSRVNSAVRSGDETLDAERVSINF